MTFNSTINFVSNLVLVRTTEVCCHLFI